jgi:hypothetical protein
MYNRCDEPQNINAIDGLRRDKKSNSEIKHMGITEMNLKVKVTHKHQDAIKKTIAR